MAFSAASIKYKPLRVGFLVRQGSIEDLVTSAGINSMLWGGQYNPIIPVEAGENAFAKQLMDLFSVDILYAVAETHEIQALQKEFPFLVDPAHLAGNLFYEDYHSKKKVAGLLDVKNIIDLFWDKEFKHKADGYKSDFLLSEWSVADPIASVLALQFGYYPEKGFKWDYKKLFLKGLHAQTQQIAPTDSLPMVPRKAFGPLDLTCSELRGYNTGAWRNRNGLFLGRSDSFDDLVSFWNIRGAGIGVVFVPIDHLARAKAFGQGYIDYLDARANSHPDLEDRLTIYHRIDDETEVNKLAQQFTAEKPIVWNQVKAVSWNGLNIQPNYFVFKWQNASAQIEKSDSRYIVNIQLPPKNFLLDDDDLSDVAHQQLSVIIEPYSSGEYDHPGHTLKLPNIRLLNEFYSRELVFDPWAIRVESDGFSKIIQTAVESISLYPIPTQKLIERVLKTADIDAKTSQAGLIAKKIIEKIGGLEDGRVLKIKGVRMLLEKGTARSSVSRGEATRTINENDFGKHKRLYIEPRDTRELDSNAVFDYLLKRDYFRAGLELTCDHCRLANWLSLKQIDDEWLCEYCGGKNQTSLHLKHKGDWKFRKSGLFAKDNHQEGAIPVLLTLLTIKRIVDRSNFSYTTALELRGKDFACETDLFVMREGRRFGLEMCIGECKSEGGVITKDDCEKLGKAAKQLGKIKGNNEVYIVFAKTADSFRPDEIELFRQLSNDTKLILLTNRELEPYQAYWGEAGAVDEDVPEKYAHSLADLHRNSRARYFANVSAPNPACN